MFDEGVITKMNYAGSVQPTDLIKIQQAIQQTFGKNPYKRQQANREDIYEYALRFGAEDWEANQLADAYEAGVVEGAETPIYYNYKEAPKDDATSALLKMMNKKMMENPYRVYDDILAGKYATQRTEVTKDMNGNNFMVSFTDIPNDAARKDFSDSSVIRTITENVDGKDVKKQVYYGTAYSAKGLQPLDISAARILDAPQTANIMYEEDAKKAKENGVPYYGTPVMKVKIAFDTDSDAELAGVWDNDKYLNPQAWFTKEDASDTQKGNFKRENGEVVGDVYIPIKTDYASRSLNNAPKTEFDDYDNLLKTLDYSMYFGLGNASSDE